MSDNILPLTDQMMAGLPTPFVLIDETIFKRNTGAFRIMQTSTASKSGPT